MNAALWLLLRLRFGAWLRRLGRGLRTPKGILLALLGGLVFVPWIISLVVSWFIAPDIGPPTMADGIRHYGPIGLFAYALLVVLTATPDRAVVFSPAEVDFLFPGPFSRRQLLGYKIVAMLLQSAVGTLFLTLISRSYGRRVISAYVGLLLTTMFLQLLRMAVGLGIGTVGALAHSRMRKIVLGGVLAGVVAFQFLAAPDGLDPSTLMDRLNNSPVVAVVLTPFRWFTEAITAQRLWPDLVRAVVFSGLVNTGLLALVFAFDAQYLEAAATASARLYTRLQRIRSGGAAAQWGTSGKTRVRLPSFPWWGGAGPVAWRQLLAGLRGLRGVVIFLCVIGALVLWQLSGVFTGEQTDAAGDPGKVFGTLASLVVLSLLLLPSLLTFDFRGDLDRMDVLKSLPVPAAGLVVGQLLTPVVLASALLVAALAILGHWLPIPLQWLGITAAFALPANFLLFAVENLLFLLFPARFVPGNPADFQILGRRILVFWAKFLILGAAIGLAVLPALLTLLLWSGHWPAALATAWLVLAAEGVGFVPLLVLAFRRFDVARDTPA